MENNELVVIPVSAILPAYVKYVEGKGPNPFLLCGCVTPKTIVYPKGYNPKSPNNK